MTAFDDLLNILVPFLVVIAMLWILYKPFKKPLDTLGGWIMKLIRGKDDEGEQLEGYNLQPVSQNLDFQ